MVCLVGKLSEQVGTKLDPLVPPIPVNGPLSSNRQHYHIDVCLEDNREDYSNYHYVNYICMRIMEFLQF